MKIEDIEIGRWYFVKYSKKLDDGTFKIEGYAVHKSKALATVEEGVVMRMARTRRYYIEPIAHIVCAC